MNEKFFSLSKEKQDRIMNGALKVFAQEGFDRASTDIIVKEASISKGLLFHYFISKSGLYEFIFNYSTRYMNLEQSNLINQQEEDYFVMIQKREYAKLQVLKNYPYMQLFLYGALEEKYVDNNSELKEKRESVIQSNKNRLDGLNLELFLPRVEFSRLHHVVEWTLRSLLQDEMSKPVFLPEVYYKEAVAYLEMIKSLVYIVK